MGNEGMALWGWCAEITAEALGWPAPLNRLSILNAYSKHLFGYRPGLLAWGMAGLAVRWSPQPPNTAQQLQLWDNLVNRGRISTQVTAEVRIPSRQQHSHFIPMTCYPKLIPRNSFMGWAFLGGWGVLVVLVFFSWLIFLIFFFPLSWFTLHSQDVIKVQSEERRGTSSVSAISSTSC